MGIHDYNKGVNKGFNNTGLPTNASEIAGHMAGQQQRQNLQRSAMQNSHSSGIEHPEWVTTTLPKFTGLIGLVIGVAYGIFLFGVSGKVLLTGIGGGLIGLVIPFLVFWGFFLGILIFVVACVVAIFKLFF